MRVARKLVYTFDSQNLVFGSAYNPELEEVLSNEEFDEILTRINIDLAAELQENNVEMQRWHRIFMYSLIALVGVAVLPVVLTKTCKQNHLLNKFYRDVRDYLNKLNKTFSKRHVELNIAKLKQGNTDAQNLRTNIQLEIVYESPETKEGAAELIRGAEPPKTKSVLMTPYDIKLAELEEEEEEEVKAVPQRKHRKHRHHHHVGKEESEKEMGEAVGLGSEVDVVIPEKKTKQARFKASRKKTKPKNIPLWMQDSSEDEE